MNSQHQELTEKLHFDEHGQPQLGPCFGFFLPAEFPLGNGWTQCCPNRDELMQCKKKFDRVVAAYEVAIGHLFECVETITRLKKECEELRENQPVEIKSTGNCT
jgi:hypothetical protein